MGKKRILFLAFGGIVILLWGIWCVLTIPEFFPIYEYAWGSGHWRYIRNPSHTTGWFFVLIGIAQVGLATYLYRRSKSLQIECIDLVLDEDDPLRCHLIKLGKVINSGTRYVGEDGEVHIKWDKPRKHRPWKVDKRLIADELNAPTSSVS